MRTYLDCYACFVRQALSAARMADADDAVLMEVVNETLALLQALPPSATPPEIAHAVHTIVRDRSGVTDPYLVAKAESTRAALALYPRLKALVAESADPLEAAVRVSIGGNIIDLGVRDDVPDLWATVEQVMATPLAIDHLAALRSALTAADHVLYLADNAGETVFDRVLVEQLGPRVVYAVKGGPVLNDATLDDALAAGLGACATVVENGSRAPGTVLTLCSAEFRDAFARAPLILAKGQANYETLSEAGPRVFCLLQVKCPVLAQDVGAPVGSAVVRQSCARPAGDPPSTRPVAGPGRHPPTPEVPMASTHHEQAQVIVCVPVTADRQVAGSWGRAERLALVSVLDGRAVEWVEHEVAWDRLHDEGTEGAHHARVARFLREQRVDVVLAEHMGTPMQNMIDKLGIQSRLGVRGDATAAALAAAARG